MRKRRRLWTSSCLAVVIALVAPGIAISSTYEAVSGLVPNNASWAYYTTQRLGTYIPMNVESYPGADHMYAYLRRCVDNNPIGYYTSSDPAVYTKPSHGYVTLANFPANTCFRITARKDWTWPWGSVWWTGNLYY